MPQIRSHSSGLRLCGIAGLPLLERLLDLAGLRLLQQADFGGEFLQRRRDYSQGGDELSVAVALQYLVGNGRRRKPQLGTGYFFHLRRNGGIGAHRAGYLAVGDYAGGFVQAAAVALHLLEPQRQFQAEGGRLGVYAVGAPYHEGVLMLERQGGQRFHQFLHILRQYL